MTPQNGISLQRFENISAHSYCKARGWQQQSSGIDEESIRRTISEATSSMFKKTSRAYTRVIGVLKFVNIAPLLNVSSLKLGIKVYVSIMYVRVYVCVYVYVYVC